jgi:hypothetical protein
MSVDEGERHILGSPASQDIAKPTTGCNCTLGAANRQHNTGYGSLKKQKKKKIWAKARRERPDGRSGDGGPLLSDRRFACWADAGCMTSAKARLAISWAMPALG